MSDPLPFSVPRTTVKDKLNDVRTHFPQYASEYALSLFPIISWIHRYNLTWLIGDLIAGFTVGAVVIPQGMAYAKVATLAPEYGLYSSFVGVCIYLFFATSKDITIGPTAVMSLVMGQTLTAIASTDYSPAQLAAAYSLITGCIALFLGIIRFGRIVNIIPGPAIAGFITGSAITITIGQIAGLLGIAGIDTKKQAYLVLGRTLGALGRTKVDAAIGLVTLVYLYALKFGSSYLTKKYPRRERVFFFISILRNFTAVLIATFVSWLVNRHKQKTPAFSILKTVPSGFQHMGAPTITTGLLSEIASHLPIVALILVLEHVAIAKSFGRLNDYRINPSQEFIAIGITNILGSFFGAYPATGSFSRTAIKSKSGVRTPLAGIFSGIVVVLALYALTPVFFYIPGAALNAIIIHAVIDLISSPTYVKNLYRIQFWDFFVFVCSIVFTFFFTLEIGIYVSSGVSLFILLLRLAFPRIEEIGRLVLGKSVDGGSPSYAYVPIDHPSFTSAKSPPEGVLIIRLDEALTYLNASLIDNNVVDLVKTRTRKFQKYATEVGDRPWNDSGDKEGVDSAENNKKPRLKALVFDFSAVSVIDSTGVQGLIDIRKEVNKYSDHNVEYHFANILDDQIQNALIVAGFDKQTDEEMVDSTGAEIGLTPDEENNVSHTIEKSTTSNTTAKRFFHLTLEEAVQSVGGEWE